MQVAGTAMHSPGLVAMATNQANDDRGRSSTSPWQMPLSGWRDVLLRTFREASKDNAGLVAAGVAFYAFLALVPLLAATVLTYGLVASPQTVLKNMQTLTSVMPKDVAGLVGEQLLNVVKSSSGKKGFGILLSLAVALFGARNAAGAIITALNIAYEEEEKRGFFKVTLIALAITASAVILALVAIAAITALRFLTHLVPGTSGFVVVLGRVISGVVLFAGAAAAAATLYRYAPSRDKAKWRWLTPGTALAAIGWLLLTVGFGLYVSRFGNYNATYGSLAAVVVLLTWIYLSSYIFLYGAELNSELEHQTARDTTRGGAKPPGERGAWSADHVANGSHDQGKEGDGVAPSAGESLVRPAAPPLERVEFPKAPGSHGYLVSRATNRMGRVTGAPKIGMVSSALSTLGLSLLRRRGKSVAGGSLIAAAVGLALLDRTGEAETD